MKYKISSHTADLRLEIYGKTLEELFVNAAEALADILAGHKPPLLHIKEAKEKIEIRSVSLNALLVDFLNEILARSQINKAIYRVHDSKVIMHDSRLEAELVGAKVSKFDKDVKAVTYHEAEIKNESGTWKTKLVLDI